MREKLACCIGRSTDSDRVVSRSESVARSEPVGARGVHKAKLDDCQTAVPGADADIHRLVGHKALGLLALVDDCPVNGPLKSRSGVGKDGDRSDDSGTSNFETGNDLLWQCDWSEVDDELNSGVGEAVLVARVGSAADQILRVIFRLQTITES